MISKVNTCLQLALGVAALAQGASMSGEIYEYGLWTGDAEALTGGLQGAVELLTYSSAATTISSGGMYAWDALRSGGLLAGRGREGDS